MQPTLPQSIRNISHFWDRTAYQIGSETYTLNDIEHGIVESTLTNGKEKNATIWLRDTLNIIKDNQNLTSNGKSNKICRDMVNQFDKTYGGDWQCISIVGDRSHYMRRELDKFIEFNLKNNIRIILFDK